MEKKINDLYIIISQTKNKELPWFSYHELKEYLESDYISISQFKWIRSFSHHIRVCRFIPNLNCTYFATNGKFIYAVSRDKYSPYCRMDRYDLHRMLWVTVSQRSIDAMRLYNVIKLTDEADAKSEIEEFLYSINDVRV